jgi:hypothetical protein
MLVHRAGLIEAWARAGKRAFAGHVAYELQVTWGHRRRRMK